MLGVKPLAKHMTELLLEGKISTDAARADGYSLIPVHAWSHTVSDVVEAAALLGRTGAFEVITPSALMKAVASNVDPTR